MTSVATITAAARTSVSRRRMGCTASRIADLFEDEIVALRKQLTEAGFDGGAQTIHTYLNRRHVDGYNNTRPHRSINRRTPLDAFTARTSPESPLTATDFTATASTATANSPSDTEAGSTTSASDAATPNSPSLMSAMTRDISLRCLAT